MVPCIVQNGSCSPPLLDGLLQETALDHEVLATAAGSDEDSDSPRRSRSSGLGRGSISTISRSPSRRRNTGGGDMDAERGGMGQAVNGLAQGPTSGQGLRAAAAVISRIGEITRETLGVQALEDSDDDDRML